MRITAVRDLSVPMEGNIANALVNFSEHDISLVAVVSDVMRGGKPVIGYAFDSIGRYAQSGILRERMIPRLMKADAGELLDANGTYFDAAKVLRCILRNEKPGGHGDRAAAAGAIELAIWDLNAKLRDEPAYATIARHFHRSVDPEGVSVYAAGGYYYEDDTTQRLAHEFAAYRENGFQAFKMKIGGADLSTDMARIEAALRVAGSGQCLAVDANGRFPRDVALQYARAMAPYDLRWYEEAGDPLDFDLNAALADDYPGRLATGENLFSVQDVDNLLRYAGMRPGKDVFQMDPGLAYGLTEYATMLEHMEARGFDRKQAYPHGGHLINLHIAMGLGLGGCEAYPGVFQPFGGYAAACRVGGGTVLPSSAPGFGLEEKAGLQPWLARLAAQ